MSAVMLEYGWTTLANAGFRVEFRAEGITLTKQYGSVTVEDVENISRYVKPQYRYMVFKSDYDKVTIS